MKGKKLIVGGSVVLAFCLGWKIICLIWDGLCALTSWLWSVVCGVVEWSWSVVLKVLGWILLPAAWIAEGVFDGGGLAWCAGLAVEAILIGVIIVAISSIAKKEG